MGVEIPSSMFVYPVDRLSPQGRHDYFFTKPDGTKIPAKRTFAKRAEKRYCFPLSADGMKIDTGMDELIDNPFQNEEFAKKHVKDNWTSRYEELISKEEITLQTYLEVMHNRPPGTYTGEKRINGVFNAEAKENNYLEGYSVPLDDGTNIFTSDNPDDVLAMLCMKKNPSIAPSKREANPSLHDFYIGEENEAAVETASRRRKQGEAIAKLTTIRSESDDFFMLQLATVLKLVKGQVSPVIVNDKLDNYLWTQDKNLEMRLSKFNKLVENFNTKEGRQKIYLQYVFQSAVDKNIIQIRNGNFIWPSKKGIQNLYNLGTKEGAILNMFYAEMQAYNPDLPAENFYGDLIVELKHREVKLIEKFKNLD